MSDRVTTAAGPFLVSTEIEVDLVNGGSSQVDVWEGSETECRTKLPALVASGASKLKLSPKGDGNWQVRGQYPYDPDGKNKSYVDNMELEVNLIQRSCYQSPVYRSRFSDFNSITQYSAKANSTLSIIGDCARKYSSGLPRQVEDGANAGKFKYKNLLGVDSYYATRELAIQQEVTDRLNQLATLSGPEFTTAQNLFINIAYRQSTSFWEFNHVFRRTVTAGSPRAIRANNTGGGKIWTTAEVIAWEGLTGDDWFDMPPDVQWVKDKPRVVKAYGQKKQISYTYTEIITATALHYRAYGAAILID